MPSPRPTLQVAGTMHAGFDTILTPEALAFVSDLERRFGPERLRLLEARGARQARLDAGEMPDFLAETRSLRTSEWRIDPVPADLQDRRVEITGPVDRKMVINALNSGARVFMADFEDSHSPTWVNTLQGQINLHDAVRRTIALDTPEGKRYRLQDRVATLMVRPRGWHLPEKHVLLEGAPVSASLFDFGLYFFHNARELIRRSTGPYFYLPKMESHHEARLWNDVFVHAQESLGIPRGTIKATVLIEAILASFELHEILHVLREHSAGLNCGRWDYIFSTIKRFHRHPRFLFPDRSQVTMTRHFLRSYSLLVIQTCHRRGAHAIGGMAAQIPIKNDPRANEEALAKVRADKEREASDGHDGTWVAHPGLVEVAREVFDRVMPQANQIARQRDDVQVAAADLLRVPSGTITAAGLHTNVEVGLRYLEAWLGGVGCVPIHHLMEDAATAEISRTQLWQWIHHPQGRLDDGREVTDKLFRTTLAEELHRIRGELGEEAFLQGRFSRAAELYERIITSPDLIEFLTLPAYELLE